MATYRIAVGKRHKVEPRQIVGAIANEGGLQRGGLRAHRHPRRPLARRAAGGPVRRRPARRCERTRISGKLIELTPDGSGTGRSGHESAAKPRTKNRDYGLVPLRRSW